MSCFCAVLLSCILGFPRLPLCQRWHIVEKSTNFVQKKDFPAISIGKFCPCLRYDDTVRPWDTRRFFGTRKISVAQNLCNLSCELLLCRSFELHSWFPPPASMPEMPHCKKIEKNCSVKSEEQFRFIFKILFRFVSCFCAVLFSCILGFPRLPLGQRWHIVKKSSNFVRYSSVFLKRPQIFYEVLVNIKSTERFN